MAAGAGRGTADAEEDKAFGRDRSGEELPDWIADKKKRAEKIRGGAGPIGGRRREPPRQPRPELQAEAEERRRAEGRKKPRKARRPAVRRARSQSAEELHRSRKPRRMKTKDGFIQGYNAQAAVDATAQVIVARGLDAEARPININWRSRSWTRSKPISTASHGAAVGRRRLLLRSQSCGVRATRRRRLYRPGAGPSTRGKEKGGGAHIAAMREKIRAGEHDSPYR